MMVACIGAFAIGEYPEGVMLIILYTLGELIQGRAVRKAQRSISSLMDSRSETTLTYNKERGIFEAVETKNIKEGERILVPTGMVVPLDGFLLGEEGVKLDYSTLTGESMPVSIAVGETILAGAINRAGAFELEVSKSYEESTLSRIMRMREEAAQDKPQTELFIRKFARYYTPVVFLLALLTLFLPRFILGESAYDFEHWLYAALVLLVTSCPCALILSVPLSYSCGLGAASRHGLLFKGAIFLEALRQVKAFAFDKTGTLTKGHFDVVGEWYYCPEEEKEFVLNLLCSLEEQSKHPISEAIQRIRPQGMQALELESVKELSGYGMSAFYKGSELLIGNQNLMNTQGVNMTPLHTDNHLLSLTDNNLLYVSIGKEVKMVLELADTIKENSHKAIKALKKRGYAPLVMLSGDRDAIVQKIGASIGMDIVKGGLLPQDKIEEVRKIMQKTALAYVGDGLNDAPVMGLSTVGIAMGTLGSDATIEAADVVLQGDDPYGLVSAVDIAHATHHIVLQNIIGALTFKALIVILAVFGISSLALAIFADVGITLLAVLNATRLLHYNKQRVRV